MYPQEKPVDTFRCRPALLGVVYFAGTRSFSTVFGGRRSNVDFLRNCPLPESRYTVFFGDAIAVILTACLRGA